MRIGIISDTHGILPDSAVKVLSDCDAVLHAGDIGEQKVLDKLRAGLPDGARVLPVLGNCDIRYGIEFTEDVPERDTLVFGNVAFLLVHEPEYAREMLADFQFSPLYDTVGDIVFVHGHTHVPEIRDISEREVVICPGAISEPKEEWQRTVAKVDVAGGRVESIQIVNLAGKVAWDR